MHHPNATCTELLRFEGCTMLDAGTSLGQSAVAYAYVHLVYEWHVW